MAAQQKSGAFWNRSMGQITAQHLAGTRDFYRINSILTWMPSTETLPRLPRGLQD